MFYAINRNNLNLQRNDANICMNIRGMLSQNHANVEWDALAFATLID